MARPKAVDKDEQIAALKDELDLLKRTTVGVGMDPTGKYGWTGDSPTDADERRERMAGRPYISRRDQDGNIVKGPEAFKIDNEEWIANGGERKNYQKGPSVREFDREGNQIAGDPSRTRGRIEPARSSEESEIPMSPVGSLVEDETDGGV